MIILLIGVLMRIHKSAKEKAPVDAGACPA
jgi:hypothetical protein